MTLLQHYRGWKATSTFAAGAAEVATPELVTVARRLSRDVASFAKLSLVAGICHTLFASKEEADRRDGTTCIDCHPFFNVLSAGLGLQSLVVGGALLLDALRSWRSMFDAINVGRGVLTIAFGLFAGLNAVKGFSSSK